MWLFVPVLLIEALVSFVLKGFPIDLEALSIVLITINTVVVAFALRISIKDQALQRVLLIGYMIRVAVLLLDIYGRNVFVLPHSGIDSEAFHLQALDYAQALDSVSFSLSGVYSKLLGFFYYLFGPQRLLAQYMNTLLGMSTVVYLVRSMEALGVRQRRIKLVAICATFFPQAIVFSAILLREAAIALLVMASVYSFILWYQNRRWVSAVNSVFLLGMGSLFHSGVIAVLPVYVFILAFYHHGSGKLQFNRRSLGVFIVICVLVSVFFLGNIYESFLAKFVRYDSVEHMLEQASKTRGGSGYLAGLRYNSLLDVLLYSPLKMAYFMFSPLPWNWRGPMDIITFLIDSSIYLTIVICFMRSWRNLAHDRWLANALAVACLLTCFIYAYGTSNSGTAVRHRHKLFPAMLLMAGLTSDRSADKEDVIQIDSDTLTDRL